MERTDFTLVFDGHEIACHKHILAASSPVLRAMVENHHVEAVQSKANMELSEEVGQAFLRFIYTGKLVKASSRNMLLHSWSWVRCMISRS